MKDVVFCMVCKPPYKPHAFLDSIKKRHQYLIDIGVTPFYVFDGARHPLKLVKEDREDKIKQANIKIESFYARVKNNDEWNEDEVGQLKKLV